MKKTQLKRKTSLKSKGFDSDKAWGKSFATKNWKPAEKRLKMLHTAILGYSPLKTSGFVSKDRSFALRISKEKTPQQKLDQIVSETIRREAADDNGYVSCATCGIRKHWRNMQCGHFKRRGNLSTRYLEENLNPQCEECNCFEDGREVEHALYIDLKWGAGTAKRLEALSNLPYINYPYKEQIIVWTDRLNRIKALQDNSIQY